MLMLMVAEGLVGTSTRRHESAIMEIDRLQEEGKGRKPSEQ